MINVFLFIYVYLRLIFKGSLWTIFSELQVFFHGWDLAECGWDLAERLERLTVNAVVATVLGSIPASSDTMESEGRQMKRCWISYIKRKNSKKSPFKKSFFHESVSQRPQSISLELFQIFQKCTEIFTNECLSAVSTTPAIKEKNVKV